MSRVRLVVVTGMSGSGKSSALKALEDMGFFCVDNLPVNILPKFLELSVLSGEEVRSVAVGMDSRGKDFPAKHDEAFARVEELGLKVETLFLDAHRDALLRRFSETRRPHPLAHDGTVEDGVLRERELMAPLRQRADILVDTTDMTVHELKKTLKGYFDHGHDSAPIRVNLVSFGYRYGIPHEADLMLDVRFLPNPYFVPSLKNSVGTDPPVRDFVLSFELCKGFFERFYDLVRHLIPLYENEGKSYLTVAIGCTGGKHRSVAIVEELADRLAGDGRDVGKFHKDIER